MASRLTQIELDLEETLKEINTARTNPQGYRYLNDVTAVNSDDEAIAEEYNDYPFLKFGIDPDVKIMSGESKSYESKLGLKIIGQVICTEEDLEVRTPDGVVMISPKVAVRRKMNDLLDDILAVFTEYNSLKGYSISRIDIKRVTRVYTAGGDYLRAGDLNVYCDVWYHQSRFNPDQNICY